MVDQIEKIISQAVENGDTAGANVLVMKNGQELAYVQCGFRDMENKIPMNRDTIFRLYSQSKPVTAAAAVLLASRGMLDLGAWLSDFFPEYAVMYVNADGQRHEASKHITIRDLLNMTSGLAYPDGNTEGGRQSGTVFWELGNRLYSDSPMTTEEFARRMAHTELCYEPGERFMYGASADVLGAVIEKVSGMSFRDFLRKNFFEPLEMADTDFYVPEEKRHRLAKVYDYSDNGLYELRTDHLGLRYDRDAIPSFQSGGAGLCSTLDDYAKFAGMLMSGGMYLGRKIMPEAAVRFLTKGGIDLQLSCQLAEGWGGLTGYTYGNLMRVCSNEAQASLFASKGEYGWDGWLGTYFSNEPQHGITLLFGTQQAGIGRTGVLVRKIKNLVMSELT